MVSGVFCFVNQGFEGGVVGVAESWVMDLFTRAKGLSSSTCSASTVSGGERSSGGADGDRGKGEDGNGTHMQQHQSVAIDRFDVGQEEQGGDP